MIFKEKDVVVFYGDSLMEGFKQKASGEGSLTNNNLGIGYVNLFFGYMYSKYPHLNLRIINKGVSGNRSIDLVENVNEIVELQPNVLFLGVGVNDMWRNIDMFHNSNYFTTLKQYEENLRFLINKFKNNCKIILVGPFILEPNKNDLLRQNIDQANLVMEKLSKEYNLNLINTQKAFDKYLETNNFLKLSLDRIHVNITGNFIILDELLKTLKL